MSLQCNTELFRPTFERSEFLTKLVQLARPVRARLRRSLYLCGQASDKRLSLRLELLDLPGNSLAGGVQRLGCEPYANLVR